MIHINTKDNEFHILKDVNELKDLIVEFMGDDAGREVQELIDDADYNNDRADSDLTSFESSLQDISQLIEDLIQYVINIKKLDRGNILEKLEVIQKIVFSQI